MRIGARFASAAVRDALLPGAEEVARVAVRETLQVILMFRFSFPKVANGFNFGHDFAWPKARSVDIANHIQCRLALVFVRKVNRRTITQANIIALAIQCCGVVDLKKQFQQCAITDHVGIKNDFDAFGMQLLRPRQAAEEAG